MTYATLDEVRRGLKIVATEDDTTLTLLLDAASARIRQHLGARAPDVVEASGSGSSGVDIDEDALLDAYRTCQAATILLVELMYDTGPDQAALFMADDLPVRIKWLLKPLRKPTLA